VTGASYRALAVVRSLGRHGIPVRVVRSDEHAVASASRYAGPRRRWPVEGDDEARVAYLVGLAERDGLGGWVLIPTHDEEAALVARNHDALARRYVEACELLDPSIVMVQELIPGDGATQLSVAVLCADGEVLASLTARRVRQFPMDFGRASSHVETIDDPGLEGDVRRLIAATKFTGLVEAEFKRDERTGEHRLLDVNPRAWGWQSLCGRAGVDFPYLLWRMASGEPVPSVRAVAGVRWVRMTTDLLAVAGEVRAGRLSPRAYLRSLRRPLEFAVFAADDPLPSLVGPLATARLLGGRLAEGRPL